MKLDNKMKAGIGITLAIALFLAVSVAVSPANASLSLWDRIANVAGNILGNKLADKVEDISVEEFGAVSSPDFYADYLWNNGFETKFITGNCQKGTTTLLSVKNPFTATSTVDLFIFDITTIATSSAHFKFGTSTTAYLDTGVVINSDALLSIEVATTTDGYFVAGMTGTAGIDAADAGSLSRMFIAPNQYVLGIATSSATYNNETGDWDTENRAFTEETSISFQCEYVLRFVRNEL